MIGFKQIEFFDHTGMPILQKAGWQAHKI